VISYPARFEVAEEGGYNVQFIDLSGCITEGDSLEDAKAMAQEALTGILEVMLDDAAYAIPAPSKAKGKDIYYIEPALSDIYGLALNKALKQTR
jgi:antitoxin HicB